MKNINEISDLTPDARNANKGTERGTRMIDDSLTKLGAGRSILVDADGRVIAGNKTLQAAIDNGFPIEVVKSDGHKLVVVQREDLHLDDDERARLLAYADNRTSEVGLCWNIDELAADMATHDLSFLFTQDEVDALMHTLPLAPKLTDEHGDGDSMIECPECGHRFSRKESNNG